MSWIALRRSSPGTGCRRGQHVAAERYGHLRAGGERARRLAEHAGRDEQSRAQVRPGRVPAQLADGQPVPVGGHQGERVAGDLDPDAGQRGQGVVAVGRDRHLADGGGQGVTAHRPGQRRHLGQRRVLLLGQQDQGERGAAVSRYLLHEPMTTFSKVYLEFSRVPPRSPDVTMILTVSLLASVVSYSSQVQQPMRATAVLSGRLHTRRTAPVEREQAPAGGLHPDGMAGRHAVRRRCPLFQEGGCRRRIQAASSPATAAVIIVTSLDVSRPVMTRDTATVSTNMKAMRSVRSRGGTGTGTLFMGTPFGMFQASVVLISWPRRDDALLCYDLIPCLKLELSAWMVLMKSSQALEGEDSTLPLRFLVSRMSTAVSLLPTSTQLSLLTMN